MIGAAEPDREGRADRFGREHYVFAFLVLIILFSVGGVFSIYDGVHKIEHLSGQV